MKLADLQETFQSALLDGGSDILAHIPDSPREKKEVLFAVYRDGYALRLLGILREDFARLHAYIGDDAFDELAREFIASHPSNTPNARYFGKGFAAYVALHARFADWPVVAALAELEDALGEIFDCADAAPLTLEDLSAFAPGEFTNLTFTPHPSCRRLEAPAGLEAIFTALSNGEPPSPPGPERSQHMLVWRKDVVPHYRVLADDEAMMWDEAAKGVPFGALCELLAFHGEPDTAAVRAAGYLQGWISNGQLAEVHIAAGSGQKTPPLQIPAHPSCSTTRSTRSA